MDLNKKIVECQEIQKNILPIIYSYKQKRDSVLSEEKKEELLKDLRKIKDFSITNISKIKKETINNLKKNGLNVFEVKDVVEIEKVLRKIIGEEKLIIKSKSNIINEIGFEKMFKDKEVVETDLGDFIIQFCEEIDLHPVLPAMHLTPEKIVSVIKKKFNKIVKPTPEDIAVFAREYLRKKIFSANIGITGANVITSDGSVFILENEGNISLTTRIPKKHIIITSFEKIVPSKEDALKIVKASGIFGTGQDYPVYVNIISGPSKTADIQNKLIFGAQGAKEVYLIFVDNKRGEILKSKYKELLYCINCGACVNFCPVFHQIFNNYGSKTFPGAKGVISSFFIEGKKNAFENGGFFCTTCKSCKQNCPIGIDLSEMIKDLRKDLVKEGFETKTNKEMLENIKKYGNPFGKIKEGSVPKKLYCC